MGSEDEAEQSLPRPCRSTDDGSKRTHELTSSIVPRGTSFHHRVELSFSYRFWILHDFHAATASRVQRNSVPSTQMRCMTTANRRASATTTIIQQRLAIFIAQALSQDHLSVRGQHDLGRFVEHGPQHLVAASRYATGAVALAGLTSGWRQSKYRPDRLGVPGRAGMVADGGAIGSAPPARANTGNGHQTPAHRHRPGRRQASGACSDGHLVAKHLPDNEQRFDQNGQVREFSTSSLMRVSNLAIPTIPTLRPKLRSTAQVVVDGDSLRLQQLAMGSKYPQFLTA